VSHRAAIYARISSDREGDGLAIGRQLDDCERLAVERGWRVIERYVDQDVSAFKSRVRPAYRQMLTDLRAGLIDGVVVYHLDRLHRQPRELEEFFDVCKAAGIDDLATVTGRINLADPDGQFQARILGARPTVGRSVPARPP
jgi:site-specific DNA recombinase